MSKFMCEMSFITNNILKSSPHLEMKQVEVVCVQSNGLLFSWCCDNKSDTAHACLMVLEAC